MTTAARVPRSSAEAVAGSRPGRIPSARVPAESSDGWSPRPADPPGAPLSERDRELLRHLAGGSSTGQIAAAMSVSSNTARTRIRRVSAKLSVSGRHEVVGAARGLGLV